MKSKLNSQERIARHLLTQSPGTFIGIDRDGAGHYWDSYEFAVAVVPRGAESVEVAEKFELDRTPFATLADWYDHLRQQRGWDVGPRISGSLVGDLVWTVQR